MKSAMESSADVPPTSLSNERFSILMDAFSKADSIETITQYAFPGKSVKLASYHPFPGLRSNTDNKPIRYYGYNLPDEISAHYNDLKTSDDDPIVREISARGRHAWLSDLTQVKAIESTKHRALIEKIMKAVQDALIIPLFGPFDRKGYILMGFTRPKAYFEDIFSWQMQAMAQTIHVRYCMIVHSLRENVHLTSRESEVLELITFGKTNPEIGVILGISSSTVGGHVKKIFLKLDVQDRVTAAIKASSSNLIS